MIDYEFLRVVWWLLLGVLLIAFAIMDGFDLGAVALLPFVGKTDLERRVVINTVGPVWEGNQVWFILGGGAIFAAWPYVYAISFSGFYLAMFLVLVTFIIRPVAFKYRSKLEDSRWRHTWDWIMCIAGITTSILLGVAVGNVLQGVPFHFDSDLRVFYTGSFFGLLNPFALLCGLVSLCMLLMHGGFYLSIKASGQVAERAVKLARFFAWLLIVLFALGGVWVSLGHIGYQMTSVVNMVGPSNPMHKQVIALSGAWLNNYALHPWMRLMPVLGFLGAAAAWFLSKKQAKKTAFISSAISLAGVVGTAGVSMFPFLLPSSSNPSESLTVWDASSSQLTLQIMFICAVIFVPMIVAYTTWVFRVLRGPVTQASIEADSKDMY